MRRLAWLPFVLLPLAAVVPCLTAGGRSVDAADISWKKTVIDRAFRSEGVTVADINRDGKLDILNGEMWYEAPDWTPHPATQDSATMATGCMVTATAFACWADDINGDGYPDLIVIGFPGAPCHWFENPKGGTGLWAAH